MRVDTSWLFIAGLMLWIFYSQLSDLLPEHSQIVLGAAALGMALLFFASLLAHELGHALTSLSRGIPVIGITLFLLGGVTESTKEASRARDEFIIVGIGPFISLVLGAGFGLVFLAVEEIDVLAAVAGYLAWTNVALAVFNVLPGYPLDGGRLLRSVLWRITGSPHVATKGAARVGQLFALLLIFGAIWDLSGGGLPAGGPLRILVALISIFGWWGGLIGLFLFRGATDAHRHATTRQRLAERRARDLMGSVPPPLRREATLADVVERLQERPSLLWPVGDPVNGVLRLADLDRIDQRDWAWTRVGDLAGEPDGVTVDADESMDRVLDRLAAAPTSMLIVTDGGRPVGLITPSLVAGSTH